MNDAPENRADDEEFALRLGAQLRRTTEELDAATLSRLNQARHAALDRMAPRSRLSNGWLGGLLGLATALVLAVGLWQSRSPDPLVPLDQALAGVDAEVLLAGETLEMFEDLEFYAWLDPALSADELQAELEAEG